MTSELHVWIDDAFRVEEKYYGTWQSYDKEGKSLITSLSEDECINATRWYLKQEQENAFESKGLTE